MRICFVSNLNMGSWYSDCEPRELSPPLGLLSLAAVLEKVGHQVSLFDFNYALLKDEISFDEDFYTNIATRIENLSPHVVGFSTMCNSYHIALRMAEAVKARLPEVPIIFGGPQASVVDVETLEAFPFVDMVLRGEAEETLPRLIDDLFRGQVPAKVLGLTHRVKGRVVRNPDAPLLSDMDSLPIPAYHIFPYGTGGASAIDIGRGCPFSCSFCSTSKFWRRQFRLKSIERIIQEMWSLKQEYNATCFTFMHDIFTANPQWLHAFCDRLQAEKLEVTWSCSARVDTVDLQLLRHMADAGCRAIFYGVETGSRRMQRHIRKNLRLEKVLSTVDATIDAKMSTTLSFIAGFPTETKEDLSQTMDIIQALLLRPGVDVQLHILAPQIGTLDYDRYMERLRFDGYYSDIVGVSYKFLEPDWFRRYPRLFSSFYYFETDELPRQLLRGLDIFIHGPCSVMRGTILHLLTKNRNLWDLYLEWRDWADSRGLGGGPMAGQRLDQFLLDFYAFASDQIATGRVDFDLGHTRDEILAFYLRHYCQVPIRFVSLSTAETSPQIAEERG